MDVDEMLREAAPSRLTHQRETDRLRAAVLSRATAQRRHESRMRRSIAVLAASAALVAVGGVAYAHGDVPGFVSAAVSRFADDQRVPDAERPALAQIADLELPDGSRFAAWRGRSQAMECTGYVDHWNGRQSLGSGAVMCGDGHLEANRNVIVWAQSEDGSTHYPVLFGDTGTDATRVEVTGVFDGTGGAVHQTLGIDPATHAFAMVLPGHSDSPWDRPDPTNPFPASGLTLTFEDATGSVISTVDGPGY